MSKRELCSILQNQTMNPKRLKETQEMCSALIEEQRKLDILPEERTDFWQFLSDVMRHTGWRLWVTQGILLLLVCAGIFSVSESPQIIPVFIPLFVLACLPSFYQSTAFGMREMEAVTRASSAQIILAKLVLAGGSEIICLTVICWFAALTAEYPVTLIQLILYVAVPLLACLILTLWSMRTRERYAMQLSLLACLILTLWSMRTRERYAMQLSILSCLGASTFAGILAHWFPALYELSALGVWIMTFVIFAGFFIKELWLLIKIWKEGKIYGIVS